jgi:hypothetical protein
MSKGTYLLKNWRKLFLAASVWTWGLTFMTKAYFDTIFFRYPQSPDSHSGNVVPYVVKSVTVYINEHEHFQIVTVNWLLALLTAVGILAVVLHGPANLKK